MHCSLMTVWMRLFSSSTLRWTAMENSGSTSWSLGRWVAFRSPTWVGDQLQRADHLVLVVERGADEVPTPLLDQLLLDRGPVRGTPSGRR